MILKKMRMDTMLQHLKYALKNVIHYYYINKEYLLYYLIYVKKH